MEFINLCGSTPSVTKWNLGMGAKPGCNFDVIANSPLDLWYTTSVILWYTTGKKYMGTYLGYQVRHLKGQAKELKAWLELRANEGKALSVWGKTVVGSGCDYGVNPENWPWRSDRIKCFEDKGDSCTFCTENEDFVVEVSELPADEWGNTATYSGGINLQDGYFEVAYEDDSYTEYQFPTDWEVEESDFLEWIKENRPDLIPEISEETISNGYANEWRYVTSINPLIANSGWKL